MHVHTEDPFVTLIGLYTFKLLSQSKAGFFVVVVFCFFAASLQDVRCVITPLTTYVITTDVQRLHAWCGACAEEENN